MAIKKTVEINIDTKDAVKSMTDLGATFEDVNGEIQPMSGRMGDLEDRLYELANAGDTSSKEFKDLTGEIGRMKKVIIDTDMVVDGMSQTMAQNVGGALGGLTSGFELGAGAMGAFGVESEQVEEALLRVQSAMAISQGIQGIREAIPAFKAMRTAIMGNVIVQKLLNFVMNLNPIGMIILAVTALSAAIYALWTPIKKLLSFMGLMAEEQESAKEANDKLTASIEKQTKALEEQGKVRKKLQEQRMRELELADASEKEMHKERLKNLKEDEEARKNEIATLHGNYKDKKALYKQALAEEDEETAQSIKDELRANKDKIAELKLQNGDYTLSRKEEIKEYNAFVEADEAEQKKKRAERWKEIQAKRKEEEEKANAIIAKDKEDARKAELDAEARKNEVLDELAEAEYLATTDKNQQEIDAVSDKYFRLIELAKQYGEDTAILEDEQAAQIQAIQDEADAKAKAAKEAADKEEDDKNKLKLEKEQELQNAKLDLAQQGFEMIGSLATAFAGASEAQQKRAFEISKAASIAQAVVATYQGANAIFASSAANPASVLFPAQPFIAAGLAVAGGLANVATIAKTKFGSGASGGGGSFGSAPNIGGGSQPANFNVVGNDGNNQLAESLGGQVTKAYVVSGDVTTAQSLERNKIQTATL